MNDSHTNQPHDVPTGLPPELASLDSELARMAMRDLAAAPRRMEDRIALATSPRAVNAGGSAGGGADVVYSFPARGDRGLSTRWSFRVAALLALGVTVGLVLVSLRSQSGAGRGVGPMVVASAASVERDVDSWLKLTDPSQDEILQLTHDSESLDSALVQEPSVGMWFLDGEPL